eukprot:3117283-Pleurochrysis_carterae.AAC.1
MRRSRRGEIRVKASARKKRAKETHLAPGQDAARCPSRLVSRPASEPTILQVIPYGFVKRDARLRPPTARFRQKRLSVSKRLLPISSALKSQASSAAPPNFVRRS